MAYTFDDLVAKLESTPKPFAVPADEWTMIQQGAADLLTRLKALETAAAAKATKITGPDRA